MHDDEDGDIVANISPGIRHLAVPIDSLIPLPNNYHHGDVAAVAASYQEFGQRKPITTQIDSDGKQYITTGNTQWKAAKSLGWTHIAAEAYNEDRKKAVAWALADNRTAELGYNDEDALAEFLSEIEEDLDLFNATGYDLLDYEQILEDVGEFEQPTIPSHFDEDEPAPTSGESSVGGETSQYTPGRPIIQYSIIFDDAEQQQKWYQFVRWLKGQYRDGATIAERLIQFLEDTLPEEQ